MTNDLDLDEILDDAPDRTIPPPVHLSAAGAVLWARLQHDFALVDPAALQLLQRCCEAADAADAAHAIVAAEGQTYTNRFGEPRPHPAVAIERDARTAVRQHLHEMQLTAPLPDSQIPRIEGWIQ